MQLFESFSVEKNNFNQSQNILNNTNTKEVP